MAAFHVDDIVDMVTLTLKNYGPPNRYTLLAQKYRDYESQRHLWRKERVTVSSGVSIQRQIMVAKNANARMIDFAEPDQVNYGDLFDTIEIPWRIQVGGWTYDERESAFNRDAAMIVNIIRTRAHSHELEVIELREDQWFATPASSADELSYWGLLYWITAGATKGFTGADPTGFATGAGGMLIADVPEWSPYWDSYTAVSVSDLIPAVEEADLKTGFKKVTSYMDYRDGSGTTHRIQMGDDPFLNLRQRQREQNENLGVDLNAYSTGEMTFGGNPAVNVPKLNDVGDGQSLFGTNYADFEMVLLRNWFENSYRGLQADYHHRVMTLEETIGNPVCTNRRGSWRIDHT